MKLEHRNCFGWCAKSVEHKWKSKKITEIHTQYKIQVRYILMVLGTSNLTTNRLQIDNNPIKLTD